jgi:hypothetical protein
LVEALVHPDESCRRAAVEHIVRTCIPAVIRRLIVRLVGLLDGAGTTRRQALASLSQFGGLAALLGETVQGFVGSDRWSAYARLSPFYRQSCRAHLKRAFRK